MSTAGHALVLPPGLKFKPNGDQLIRSYLLPRARGQAAATTGLFVIEDEGTGAAVPPWELLARHGRTQDEEAYFFERISKDDGKGRSCGGGWTWVSQRCTPDKMLRLPGGEEITWNKRDLNLHQARGREKRSGSTGWVMHEYRIISPPCPFPVKLCHVAFTGHGRKRQRVPEYVDAEQPPPCKRAVAASSFCEASKTTVQDQKLLLAPFGQDQECSLNQQQPQGFNQEQLQSDERSSVLTICGSDAGSTHGSCSGQQELLPFGQYQEYFLNQQQPQGFYQEQLQSDEESSVLTICSSDAGSTHGSCSGQQELLPFGQYQEYFLNQQQPQGFYQEQLQSYEGPAVLTGWGSDAGSGQETYPGQQELLPFGQDQGYFLNQQQPHGIHQEQLQGYEGSSVLTHWGPNVESSDETCPGQQELAYYNQQQWQIHHWEAYDTQLASDIGASLELPAGLLLTQDQEQPWPQQFNHLGIQANAYHEEHVQMTKGTPPPPTEEPGTVPPRMDPGSPDDLEALCKAQDGDLDTFWDNVPEEQGAT